MSRALDGAGEQTEDTETDGCGVVEEHPILSGPVLDNIYPTREEGRAQVSGNEIEDIDDHTTQEGAVEHPERHQWMFSPLHLVNDEED